MHTLAPAVIVKVGTVVITYALVMLTEAAVLIPELAPMFNLFNQLFFKTNLLTVTATMLWARFVQIKLPWSGCV